MPHELEGEHHPLTPEEKLRIRREAIPQKVARSMAFEGEPVTVERIRGTRPEHATRFLETTLGFPDLTDGFILGCSRWSALCPTTSSALMTRRCP
jgi:hypothetical protein